MIARPPSLRAITAFEAAARLGSFTKAAEELNLTHGAVSHAVRGLEARLGAPLFARLGRSLQLSEEGSALAARVRLGLGLLGEAFTPLEHRRRAASLVVGASATIAGRVLMPAMLRIDEDLPDVAARLSTDERRPSAEGGCDVYVHLGDGGWSGCVQQVVGGDALYPVVSPSFQDGKLPRSLDELRRAPLVSDPAAGWFHWLMSQGQDPQDFAMRRVSDEPGLALEAAALGAGVAIARHRLARRDLASGRLVRLELPQVVSPDTYRAAWNPASRNAATAEAFVGWLRDRLAEDDLATVG